MPTGNMHDPDRCKVTVYTCCEWTDPAKNSYGHQCHEEPVKDGICLKHLADKKRLLGTARKRV